MVEGATEIYNNNCGVVRGIEKSMKTSNWVEIRLYTENQLPRLFGRGLKVCCGGGGWGGGGGLDTNNQ